MPYFVYSLPSGEPEAGITLHANTLSKPEADNMLQTLLEHPPVGRAQFGIVEAPNERSASEHIRAHHPVG